MININLLPRHLRRVREPGYWRFIAVLFPLIVFGTLFAVQFTVNRTIQNLETEIVQLEERKRALQPFIARRDALLTQQQQLNQLIAIRNQVQQNRIAWTGEINSVLETLPSQGDSARPRISFQSLNMAAVVPPTADPNLYEGQPYYAQMNISGQALNTEVLAEFVRALETSSNYGVGFQNASRNDENEIYSYNLTVGALNGGGQ